MSDAIITITSKNLGCTAVVSDNNKPIGIITDGDLRRHMNEEIIKKKVSDIMTKDPITVKENILATEALAIMNKKSITSLCVVDNNGCLAGIVHIHALLRTGVS